MTDNDIIKAFKLCITCTDDKCRRCPMKDVPACTVEMEKGILDIIDRRDAEILRLQKYHVAEGNKLLAEIARLKTEKKEVVRCKDCKNAYINSFSAQSGIAVCRSLANRIVQQDDFCSYGERKEPK